MHNQRTRESCPTLQLGRLLPSKRGGRGISFSKRPVKHCHRDSERCAGLSPRRSSMIQLTKPWENRYEFSIDSVWSRRLDWSLSALPKWIIIWQLVYAMQSKNFHSWRFFFGLTLVISARSCSCTSSCLEYAHVRQQSTNVTLFFPTAQLFLGGQHPRWATGLRIVCYTDGCVCKPDNRLGTDDIKSLDYGYAAAWSLGLCCITQRP